MGPLLHVCTHPLLLPVTPPLVQPSEVESLRQLFQHIDEDATGTISMEQLQDAMRHMGKQVGGEQRREQNG